MKLEMAKMAHEAAIALGAECDDSCVFNDVGVVDQVKSYTLERARVFTILSTMS